MRSMNIEDIPRCNGLDGDKVNSLSSQPNLPLPYITDSSEVEEEGAVKRKRDKVWNSEELVGEVMSDGFGGFIENDLPQSTRRLTVDKEFLKLMDVEASCDSEICSSDE